MKSQEVYNLMDNAVNLLSPVSKNIKLDELLSVYSGTTVDNYTLTFSIGIKELYEDPDKEWSTAEAMIPIVGLFHEVCGHGGQIKYEFDKDTALSKVLALNYYACKSSVKYYGFDKNGLPTDQYYHQSHEIAAQYMGIKTAYKFLKQYFSPDEASDMLIEYVNYRMNNNSEFIHTKKNYKHIDEVLSDFDREFQNQAKRHREYDLDNPCHDCISTCSNDHNYVCKLISKVSRCQDGMKQDWMMSAIYIAERDGNYYIRGRPVFKNTDLSVEKAFELGIPPVKPKPKKQDLQLAELYEFSDILKSGEDLYNMPK